MKAGEGDTIGRYRVWPFQDGRHPTGQCQDWSGGGGRARSLSGRSQTPEGFMRDQRNKHNLVSDVSGTLSALVL